MHPKKDKRSLKYIFSALTVSTALLVTPLPANDYMDTDPTEPNPIGLWKANMFDIVMSVEKCSETKLCPTIYWIAPEETKIYDYFSYLDKTPPKESSLMFIDEEDIEEIITREQILELCGQEIKAKIAPTKTDPKHWKGEMYVISPIFGVGIWADTDIRMTNDNRIDIKLQKFMFEEKDTWKRIPKSQYSNYPKCSPPSLNKDKPN